MMIRTPRTGMGIIPGLGRITIGALGQDDTEAGDYGDDGSSSSYPVQGPQLPPLTLPTDSSISSMPTLTAPSLDLPPISSAELSQISSNILSNPSANLTPSTLSAVVQQGTASGLSAAQITAIANAAEAAGTKILQVTTAPSLIPGTNLVYNPSTGQILPSGTTLSSVFGNATLSGSGTFLLIGGGLLVLLLLMKK